MTARPIAMHAERVAGDPRVVRWVVPAGSLPVGRVRTAPGALRALFDDGTLEAGLVEHTAVWLWLSEGHTWATRARAVEAALRAALPEPGGWRIEPDPGAVLTRVVTDVLAGSAGDIARSHGGSARVQQSGDGEVSIELGGACEHCPAADYTLRRRLMAEIRRRCPDAVEVERGDQFTVALAGR